MCWNLWSSTEEAEVNPRERYLMELIRQDRLDHSRLRLRSIIGIGVGSALSDFLFGLIRPNFIYLIDPKGEINDPWEVIPDEEVDLVVIADSVHLMDRHELMRQLYRVMHRGARGYMVISQHSDNRSWVHSIQDKKMEDGHRIHFHTPFDLCRAAEEHNLDISFQPIQPRGWTRWSESKGFDTYQEVVDIHYGNTIAFHLIKPAS